VGPVLGTGLPAGVAAVAIDDEASIALVRQEVRRLGGVLGLAPERFEALATAASELGHNQLAHGYRGWMVATAIQRGGVPGIQVVAVDTGKGIADPTTALAGRTRATGSLGVGLSAVYRLSDEVDFDVRLGEGTFVAARKFASPLPRNEVSVFGRPIPGEQESGDDAGFVYTDEAILFAVADGLGHGSEAREASARALAIVRADPGAELPALLSTCDRELQRTRGTVMALARVDRRTRELSHAAAGNISTHLYRPGVARRFVSSARVLGAAGPSAARIAVERMSLEQRSLLVMFSDGVSARADLAEDPELLRQPPLVIAHQVLVRHGRTTDDALVLVASCA
jgi:anti-sigma regulatory factor (Ser/Thr protein kinase)/serine/threonine protein phosphatase PrpC